MCHARNSLAQSLSSSSFITYKYIDYNIQVDTKAIKETHASFLVQAAGPLGIGTIQTCLTLENPGLSISEQQAQFALWSIFAAPLFISTDLRQ
jgi:hypothetical protein